MNIHSGRIQLVEYKTNYCSIDLLEEYPQPENGSICSINEFYQYCFIQIQQNLNFTQKCKTTVNTKTYIELVVNKKGMVIISNYENNIFDIKIPNFDTPGYLKSKPVDIKFKLPIQICLK